MVKILKKLSLLLLSIFIVSCSAKNDNVNKEKTSIKTEVKENFKGKYIVDAKYLEDKLSDNNTIFIDTRGEKGASSTGTIENAVVMTWQDIADVFDKKPGEEGWGHILSPEKLSEKLSNLGIDKNKEIILFSIGNVGWGEDGRILWELKAAGYNNLKMVDGGYNAIKKQGIKCNSTKYNTQKAKVTIDSIDFKNTIDTKELSKEIKNYKIVDTREKSEYDGATKYGEAKGGHIPGAINIPYSSLYNKDGMLKSNEEIIKIFKENNLSKNDKIVTYCTGGIRSAFMQLIMEMNGYENVKNYEGSYYNWCVVNDVEK